MGGRGAPLPRYVAAASLARLADGGGIIALILLVAAQDGPTPAAAARGGMLAACLTAPHLLGPLVARRVDVVADARQPIAAACILYALCFATAVLTFGLVPFPVSAALVALTGTCGPLLTGGLSSRLPGLVASGQRAQRRAQGWDVATYGLGGTVGPAAVAAVAASATPATAALCLAGAAAAAAGAVLMLPAAPAIPGSDPGQVPTARATIRLMLASPDLRRTLIFTMSVACSVASLPIAAVGTAARLGLEPAAAAALAAAYGLGNLLGSGAVMVFPLRGEPRRLMPSFAALIALGLAATAASPLLGLNIAAYSATGILNASFFAATLAARSENAPGQARGQVFIWVAALKITSGSIGTLLAGLLASMDPRIPLLAGAAAIAVLSVAAARQDRAGTAAPTASGHRPVTSRPGN
ncbi:MFS transporter [Arthrobacter sp. I2-34]|uniref:MFS transporter n=1 Tax=Arthrobacter hankyongi TaxID=2904801 RepID=A0ABS9LAJ8_9MICC|nr:MFS transporter [Arthrobacter hankyongi]MCG2623716.1 MFS transporter [Arthrobacter hankyongi]